MVLHLTQRQAKQLCLRYIGCSWDAWVFAVKQSGGDLVVDTFHEAWEALFIQRFTGKFTPLTQAVKLPCFPAAHSMACLLTAMRFGSPCCPAPLGDAAKCRFCAVKASARLRGRRETAWAQDRSPKVTKTLEE